jgi:hypothetical protein
MSRDPRHSNVVTKPSIMSALLARLFEQTIDTLYEPLYEPIVHQYTKHLGSIISKTCAGASDNLKSHQKQPRRLPVIYHLYDIR